MCYRQDKRFTLLDFELYLLYNDYDISYITSYTNFRWYQNTRLY